MKGHKDVQLLAISTDSHRDSKKMIRNVNATYGIEMEFPLLEDSGHKVIARYGLLNMNTAPGPSTRRFATPGTFVIDKSGVVRWRLVDDNWKLRPTSPVIVAALEKVRAGEDASGVTLDSMTVPDAVPEAVPEARAGSIPADMVLIPAGSFTMGTKGRATGDSPEHEVQFEAFYIDKHEVSNRQYREFLSTQRRNPDHSRCHPREPRGKDHTPAFWNDRRYNGDNLPVVGVDWFDAYAYAAWAGKALPTEAQWELAARGGLDGKDFPWGDEVNESQANINPIAGENEAVLADQGKLPSQERTIGPKPVGSYRPNGLGVFDTVGNVEEWCFDWYDASYYGRSPRMNPRGSDRGLLKVVRGGSWHHAKGRAHTRYTHPPTERAIFLGFRCVRRPAPLETAGRP